jgi:hypothetical protein
VVHRVRNGLGRRWVWRMCPLGGKRRDADSWATRGHILQSHRGFAGAAEMPNCGVTCFCPPNESLVMSQQVAKPWHAQRRFIRCRTSRIAATGSIASFTPGSLPQVSMNALQTTAVVHSSAADGRSRVLRAQHQQLANERDSHQRQGMARPQCEDALLTRAVASAIVSVFWDVLLDRSASFRMRSPRPLRFPVTRRAELQHGRRAVWLVVVGPGPRRRQRVTRATRGSSSTGEESDRGPDNTP